ncbi:stage III sporulation protein AF [Natronincola peptidivorans]|uniref:Stage III sporulation protein AF n=1 Tax=Natronincola peptidivorans TaxID=426128 RepID=A0A1H9YPJ4_9FIRM|nr:stage III sporulation protein AF [Natronincola peptidivorans]SES70964.1 stage III sporulation protein AF [Natronincola peptidivorans]
MEIIREWIIAIVSVIIFVTFVEILIPNSNNKRYINVVVGLLIMVVILSPLLHFVRGDVNFNEKILQASSQIDYNTTKNRLDSYSDMHNQTIVTLYKSQLTEQMKYRIENLSNLEVVDIVLEIEEEEIEYLGFIYNAEIVLRNMNTDTEINKDIEPVQIDVSLNKNINNEEVESIWINNEKETIKSHFKTYFNLPKDNVNIHILKDK